MVLYRRVKIWSVLLRIFHWTFALSILVLFVTGYYIHNPFALGPWEGSPTNFLMAKVRYVHFLAGYFFIAALLLRFYLLIFGNRYERFTDFIFLRPRNIPRLFHTIKAYLYLGKHESYGGHNPLAGTIYLLVLLMSVAMALSGLYMLYPEGGLWASAGFSIFKTQQMARLFHYFLFWIYLVFVMLHLYLVVWNDIFGDEGLISGIFSGRKFLPAKKG